MPRFSANLNFLFNERPFLDRFAAAAAAGFTAVEFPDPYSYPREELTDRLREHALDCVLLNLPMGDRSAGEMGIACLPDRRAEFRESVAAGVAAATALRCPRLNCLAGRQRQGDDPGELRAVLLENLGFCAREFARAGLTLCVEPINTVDVPGFVLSRSEQAVDLLREVGEANLKLQYDCYHMRVMGDDLQPTLSRLLPVIGHIQIGDLPGRHEPGSGEIPYPLLFRQLDQLGYRGWVGAEYRPSRRTEETFAWKRQAESGG
jgi:hydroxypyruvate isomerase